MAKVLICEDDAVLAADLALGVEEVGHRVMGIYTTAGDALSAAALEVPDVAFIDLELADGLTGSDIARSLHCMGVKVIVLSGHPNIGAGLGVVPHTYAAKPVTPDMVEFLLCPPSAVVKKRKHGFAGPPLSTV